MTLLTNSQEKGPEDEQMDHARKQVDQSTE